MEQHHLDSYLHKHTLVFKNYNQLSPTLVPTGFSPPQRGASPWLSGALDDPVKASVSLSKPATQSVYRLPNVQRRIPND